MRRGNSNIPIHRVAMLGLVWCAVASVAQSQWLISANENHIDLTQGKPRWLAGGQPGSLSVIYFAQFPPTVRHWRGFDNTVIGPPTNVAISRDGKWALLANSIRAKPDATPDPWEPAHEVHRIDLSKDPPAVIGTARTDAQPSGLVLSRDESWALVVCRAAGTLQRLEWSDGVPRVTSSVKVCEPTENAADVALSIDESHAYVSIQKGGYLRVVTIRGTVLSSDEHRISVAGQPYRVVALPDGRHVVTAGQGFAQNGVDFDALTIVDVGQSLARAVDYVTLGAVTESLEVSPDGEWIAAVAMNGSHLPHDDPRHQPHGEMILVKHEGERFQVAQRVPIGRIPEGVAFTADGQYLLVQAYPDRQISIFQRQAAGFADTAYRIDVPGMPAALRASR